MLKAANAPHEEQNWFDYLKASLIYNLFLVMTLLLPRADQPHRAMIQYHLYLHVYNYTSGKLLYILFCLTSNLRLVMQQIFHANTECAFAAYAENHPRLFIFHLKLLLKIQCDLLLFEGLMLTMSLKENIGQKCIEH